MDNLAQMNKQYDSFLLDSIGYIPSKTDKILHKNKQRANKITEQKDFEKAFAPADNSLYLS